MSLLRWRSGGRVTTSKERRSSRSARNRPCSTSLGRCSLVAATIRTSTLVGREAPIRVTSPYSTARSNRSWAPDERVASSSRKSVPPSASSKRPTRDFDAPVKDPASWPNNSASISVSGKAAQFITTSGSSQRGLRRWRRSATSSLPVPRSPITSTGRSSAAARLARSSASRKGPAWPLPGAARSKPDHWRKSPTLGNRNNDQFRIIFFQNRAIPPFFAFGTVRAEHQATPTWCHTDTRLTERTDDLDHQPLHPDLRRRCRDGTQRRARRGGGRPDRSGYPGPPHAGCVRPTPGRDPLAPPRHLLLSPLTLS